MSSTYNNTKELRFWCQKVLPLVYDDSLSYYELLNKIVVYLNSTIEDVQTMIADVTRIEQGFSSKIDVSQKGVANGVATLNGQGKVPLTQLPDLGVGVQTISVNGVNVPADENKNVNIIVMTNAVSNLVNYYLKTETYNKTEVNSLIDSVKNSRFEVVTQLPTTDIQTNVIYLVPKSVGQTQNGYDEFINVDGTTSGWELIGSTDIDLSGYVTDSELATALSAYVTTQSLNTALAGYVTSGALATALEGYVTNATFQTLSGTVSSQGNAIEGLTTSVNGKVDKGEGGGIIRSDGYRLDVSSPLVLEGGPQPAIELLFGNLVHGATAPPSAGDVADALADKMSWEANAKTGVHQLIPYSLASLKAINTGGTWNGNVYTYDNHTFTVNDDLSVTVASTGNTTASREIYFWKPQNAKELSNVLGRNITISGATGGTPSTYMMTAYRVGAVDGSSGSVYQSTDVEKTFEWKNNCSGTKPLILLGIESGVAVNTTIKPLLRFAEDTCTDFTLPAMTNRELTDTVSIESNTINIAQGLTAVPNQITKQGKIVDLYARIDNLTISQSENTILGTTPYIPIDEFVFFDIISANSPFDLIAKGFIRGASGNGTLEVKPNSALTGITACYVQARYICK